MNPQIRILGSTLGLARASLQNAHPFALERVGFMFGRSGGNGLILLSGFEPVRDEHYERDDRVGARIGAQAISAALQLALQHRFAAFHVHIHDHWGTPSFSRTDLRELPAVMDPFRTLVPDEPHGLLVFSRDGFHALVRYPSRLAAIPVREFTVVDAPLRIQRGRP